MTLYFHQVRSFYIRQGKGGGGSDTHQTHGTEGAPGVDYIWTSTHSVVKQITHFDSLTTVNSYSPPWYWFSQHWLSSRFLVCNIRLKNTHACPNRSSLYIMLAFLSNSFNNFVVQPRHSLRQWSVHITSNSWTGSIPPVATWSKIIIWSSFIQWQKSVANFVTPR